MPDNLADKFDGNLVFFQGGWGYDQKTATIIHESVPGTSKKLLDGVSLEYVFIIKRIREELEYSRPEGERYFILSKDNGEQRLLHIDNTPYDVIKVSVVALPEKIWNEQKADWEAHKGYADDPEGRKKHLERNQAHQVSFTEEFWFDIHNFY